MEHGDLCPYCLRPGCPGCPSHVYAALLTSQTLAEERLAARAPLVVGDGRGILKICVFCYDTGGLRVPCHGCGVVGPVAVQ